MEMMMREIREGKNYCDGSCPADKTSFTFTSRAEDNLVTYSLNAGGYIERKVVNEDPQRLTSDDVNITSLYF